ncbi:MAG: OmpA family protein [Chitinophagales bacterium]
MRLKMMCFKNKWLLIAIAFQFVLNACNVTLKVKDGFEAYDLKKYALAADMLPEEYEKAKDKKEKHEIAVKIAESFLAFSETEKAENWYKKAVNLDVEPQTLFDYAMVLKQNEKYDEAATILKTFYEYDRSQRILVEGHIAACKEAYEAKQGKNYTKIINLSGINSAQSDYAPIIRDGELIFSSNRMENDSKTDDWTGKGYTNIYSAMQRTETSFDEVENWRADVNSEFHEAVVTMNAEETELYFTRCGMDDDNKDVCKIYRSFKEFDEWSKPEQLKFFDDSTNVAHPFLTLDGQQLYFTSDEPFSYGGKDLYVSNKIGDEWDTPINLGPRINTTEDEMFPYIGADEKLYFSSKGHFGIGGLDLFSAEKRGRIYTNVKSLGYPINTGGDDITIFLLESEDDSVEITGYLASNRKDGLGGDDIYFFEKRLAPTPLLPPAVFILNGVIEEKVFEDPKNPRSAVVGMQALKNTTVGLFDNTITDKPYLNETLLSKEDGTFRTQLDENVDYLLEYSKNGYFSNKDLISTKNYNAEDGDTIIIETKVVLDKIFQEIEFVLNIYYDLDKADIRKDAAVVLDSLANLLAENPSLRVELASHTDSRGDDPYNLDLSQRRANSAVTYLISKGIASDRLIAKGYGETRLVNECGNGVTCSEEQHQQNRRTTFKVVGLDYELKSE